MERELKRDRIRPIIDAEPSYEGIPQGLHDTTQPYWEAADVRRYAYWSVFEGACGHTYGHNAIMQFYRKGDTRSNFGPKEYWDEAVHAPGSMQMKYLYELMNSVEFMTGAHNKELVIDGEQPAYERITALSGHGFAYVYDYTGRAFTVDFSKLGFEPAVCEWMNPENGQRVCCAEWEKYKEKIANAEISKAENGKGTDPADGDRVLELEPPKRGTVNDWVLVCMQIKRPELPKFPCLKLSIKECGAVSNCKSKENAANTTKLIQKAIQTVNAQGGGTVVIPDGIWYTGPIELLSNVRLHLEGQAVLKFIKSKEYYPVSVRNYEGAETIRTVSPIHAEHAENIAITGSGVIDGSGELWRPVKQCKLTAGKWKELCEKSQYIYETSEGGVWFPSESSFIGNQKNIQGTSTKELEEAAQYYDFYRPVMIGLVACNKILLEGVTFTNSPAWNIHPLMCKNLTVRHGVIRNPEYAQNGDGIDVESCECVEIHDMVFQTGDDAICLKAGKDKEARQIKAPCQYVWVHDCTVFEGHGGLVIGSEMSRDVKHVLVERCRFIGTDVGVRMKSTLGRGGVVSDIKISDIAMIDIKKEAVILTMQYVIKFWDELPEEQKYELEDVPHFKNIYMKNLNCDNAQTAIKIEPLQEYEDTITDIVIEDSYFRAEEAFGGDENKIKTCLTLENVEMEI